MQLSLFWRTFLMIGALIVVSVLSALQLVRIFDRSPPDQALAWEVASIINLTRLALVNTRGETRVQLLAELASEEGVRVLPLEPTDRVESIATAFPREAAFADSVGSRLRLLLGEHTRLAARVNDEAGLWVSFYIDGDPYWLVLQEERFQRQAGPDWLLIGLLTLILSALGALIISRVVNRPLSRLARAIERVSRGEPPEVLPEGVTSEIARVNHRFNRMAAELASIESDRAVALAGISHDIRTPLSRLRMEIELSPLPDPEKDSMSSEIERIDQIVGQFLDYARSGHAEIDMGAVAEVPIAELVQTVSERINASATDIRIECTIDPETPASWRGNALDLERVLANLIENARRYGRHADEAIARVEIRLAPWVKVRTRTARATPGVLLEVRDHGPGVEARQLQSLMRPFARADEARGHKGGSGLGLNIVDRIARRYDGQCELANADGGGLLVRVYLSAAMPPSRRPLSAPLARSSQ